MRTKSEPIARGPLSGPISLSFGQIEAVLSAIHSIASDKRVAFGGRIKALQKYGLPVVGRSGRGKAAQFSVSHLIQLALGLELLQSGIPPQSAARIVSEGWPVIRYSVRYEMGSAMPQNGEPQKSPKFFEAPRPMAWLIQTNFMADLFEIGAYASREYGRVEALPIDSIAAILQDPGNSPLRPVLVLGVRAFVLWILHYLDDFKYASATQVAAEIISEDIAFLAAVATSADHPSFREGYPDFAPWDGAFVDFIWNRMNPEKARRVATQLVENAPEDARQLFVADRNGALNELMWSRGPLYRWATERNIVFRPHLDYNHYTIGILGRMVESELARTEGQDVDPQA